MDNNNSKPLSPKDLRKLARDRLNQGMTDISDWTGADSQFFVAELELHQEELRIQNEELKEARDQLESARDRYRDLFERAPVGYLIFDTEGRIREANQAAAALLAPGSHLTGELLSSFITPESQDSLYLHRRALAAGKSPEAINLTLAGSEQIPRIVRMESLVERSAYPDVASFRCVLIDVTERQRAEDQLRIAARVFQDAGEAVLVTDSATRIQSINKAFSRTTGYTENDALGVKLEDLLDSGCHSTVFYESIWESLNKRGLWQGEIWNRHKSGDVCLEWQTISRIDDDQGQTQYFTVVVSDISELKDSQTKIAYLASHDALTGLPNRSLFQDRVQQAIAQARRNEVQAALMFLDLDHFKNINDTLGHQVGDELLVQVAAQLRTLMRDVDTIARIGGDEFMLVITNCTPEEAATIARRLVVGIAGTYEVRGRSLYVTASAGLAIYPEDGEDVDFLSRSADIAMYRAKEDGRNRVRLYERGLDQRLAEDRAIEEALRRALTNRELRLVYQPQFDANDPGKLVGAEALLRWEDPEKGPISPGRFIPVAEKSELITELGWRVQELLCKDLGEWLAAGLKPPTISFNVSPKEFREGQFASRLRHIMSRCGVPPSLLQVEFTEGALTERSDIVHQEIRQLHEDGIELAIDDFGTGYSSLINLKWLPLAELKIDKSFVDGLGEDGHDEAIARASLALANALGLRTVAEGVETQAQLTWLQTHGCSRIQGYFLGRPKEAVDFRAMLQVASSS